MKSPDRDIRIGLVTALEGIVYSGNAIAVSSISNNPAEVFPRIVVNNISSSERGSKSQFMYETSVTIQISDRYRNTMNVNGVDTIADAVLERLMPDPRGPYFTLPDHAIWSITFNGSNSIEYEEKANKYVEKTIRLTIKSEEI